MKVREKTRRLALLAMFAAIVLIMGLTPLGFIPLPFINATTLHIPVIIGSIMLGVKQGAFLGFLFGLMSFIRNSFIMPNPAISFVFSPLIAFPGEESGSWVALLVCFIPRILVGVLPWLVYAAYCKLTKDRFRVVGLTIAGVAGSMINTILVVFSIYAFFAQPFAAYRDITLDVAYATIIGIITVNGVPEAIAAAILTAAICTPLIIITRRKLKT